MNCKRILDGGLADILVQQRKQVLDFGVAVILQVFFFEKCVDLVSEPCRPPADARLFSGPETALAKGQHIQFFLLGQRQIPRGKEQRGFLIRVPQG
jgi:hypothetical protein